MENQNNNKEVQLQRRVFESTNETQFITNEVILLDGEIEYKLVEYVREEGWVMDDPKRQSESVTIGPHAHGTWISRTLSVSVPPNIKKGT